MRNVHDTFLRFIADNLVGIPIHAVRRDPNEPSAALLQANALNVEFSDMALTPGVSVMRVSIDVLNDDSLKAMEWMSALWQLLRASFYVELKDYSDPSNPVALGKRVVWDLDSVRFHLVASTAYAHYSLVLPLKYTD